MTAPAQDNSTPTLNGLIVNSIPKRIHNLINLWITSQMVFRILMRWYRKYQEKMQYTVTINGSDDLYTDIQAWLLSEIPSKKRKGIRVASSNRNGSRAVAMEVPPSSNGSRNIAPTQITTWYDGTVEHAVTIKGYQVKVRNEIKDVNFVGGRIEEYNSFMSDRNKLIFVAQSTAGRDAVLELFNDIAKKKQETGNQAAIYVSTRWGGMRRMSKLSGRTLSTVILPEGVLENLVVDMQKFLDSELEYAKLGIPWHRGYLFYGEPGTGKTSLATALATHFDRDIYCVSLSSLDDDTALNNSISEIQAGSILLLEDVDIVHAARDRDDDKTGVTMQGLLNVLDGLLTPHGLITIMTTNREEVLDEALVRAGRIDRNIHVGKLQSKDISRLVTQLIGPHSLHIPSDLEVIPSDIVGIAKEHIGNRDDLIDVFTTYFERTQ